MPTSAPQDANDGETDVAGEILSPDEIRLVISAFSDLDWLRVKKAAMYFAKRCGRDWEELQNEALMRSLAGDRKCPRHVAVPTFLGNAIRSIASERNELDGHAPLTDAIEAEQSSPAGLIDISRPSDPAASTLEAQKLLAEVIALFDGDTTCETLFEGSLEGMEGQELRELLGLSEKEFDSKRRLLRRRLNSYAERNPHVR
ncbi:hypothetical protein [Bradyrhizobium sp. RP6]|uniref:hypothetical protein n=1 Tax=Bradyrhizobium sp. RP6 TaxID=2489596 RepID=UPI000F5239A4|nr:hypothetical protein [Bradyrhizobium sp. RP6]RQH12690.1 hypothetical protein EHH60_14455 [Bradyrhizobium sp. RP6]